MAAFFANLSCDPFTGRDAQCILGSYVPYAVNASGASDYLATMTFAKQHNIRLVIRNTGHDYFGKSTGAGALALWTHHLKDIAILDYSSEAYTGKAMKIGAGVQAFEAQAVANAQGLVVVEGDCPGIGLAGGYIQGGGASPLASKFGLAVDQVLEWEVATATGEVLIATPDQNSDLYWALSGGGGGTYGAVLSLTIQLHQNAPTAGATLSFTEPSDKFWPVLNVFLRNLPALLDAEATVYWAVIPGNTFSMPQTYWPGGTAQVLEKLLQPTLTALNQSGISHAFATHDYPAFQDAYHAMNPDMRIMEMNIGGRLIPRSLVASDSSTASLADAIKHISSRFGMLAAVSMNVGKQPTSPNSAHPYWRESLFLAFLGNMYDRSNNTANLVGQQVVTNDYVPALEAITPNGAAYLNEADFNQPNWQETFYGSNYPRLLSIKQRYDPDGIFWAKTAVGSEGWEIASDGRLCQV
ncbi:hypothetical protein VPNG_08072 [Cytospora leucostoma]|uniref:FAD-binding PCMH-type domain-containing protein n=1 Tax=Cytospora leucostoma TaxID=1230097 RepID=A0A423WSJ3_9PEZI|nr:hypothetical protein VPNG_08072 [Cytospora leucostoma]